MSRYVFIFCHTKYICGIYCHEHHTEAAILLAKLALTVVESVTLVWNLIFRYSLAPLSVDHCCPSGFFCFSKLYETLLFNCRANDPITGERWVATAAGILVITGNSVSPTVLNLNIQNVNVFHQHRVSRGSQLHWGPVHNVVLWKCRHVNAYCLRVVYLFEWAVSLTKTHQNSCMQHFQQRKCIGKVQWGAVQNCCRAMVWTGPYTTHSERGYYTIQPGISCNMWLSVLRLLKLFVA